MKKQIIILLVLVSTSAMTFAATKGRNNDSDSRNSRDDRRGEMSEDRGERMEEFLEDATITTISGKLELVNGEMAKLVSGKTTYTIMAPINQLIELEIKDGMKVTLEGVERVAPMVWDESEKTFIVTKITIAGKTTEIDHDDRDGMMGFGGGMMRTGNQGKGFRN